MRRGHCLRRIAFLFWHAVNILSLQSHVVYGHVGNSAAVFALQRLGVEVWPVHTVLLSNHAGYDTARGHSVDANFIGEMLRGLVERDVLNKCDAVLSGYVGSAAIGEAILGAVAQAKRANPRAVYCCDPVIGDADGGAYVAAEVAEFMRQHLVPAADIVTPNHFELEQLTGRECHGLGAALATVDELRRLGPRVVLVTSLATDETPSDAIDLLACDGGDRYRLRTPKLPTAVHGAGDAIAALFLAHYLRAGSAAEALSRAASAIFGVLKRTAEADTSEMLLIEAQDELVNPTALFRAEPL
jgi:pyridoxine kinase